MSAWTARLRTNPADAALALALTAAALAQVILFPIATPVLGAVYVVGSTLPLAWRRTHPVEAAAVSSAFWLIPLEGYPILGFVAVVLQFYALGAWGAPPLAVGIVSAGACGTGVVGTLLGPEPPVAVAGAVLSVVAPVAAGLAVAHQRRQTRALAALAAELEAEKVKVEQAAVGAERARIAREFHDVLGHELTLIAIQAEAAAAALHSAPDRAAAPVDAIRETAHRTLAEIRSTLDVLAPAGDAAASLDGLGEVARRAEQAGIPNELVVTGVPWPEHASARLAVNRIVRECLTNAGRHAPGCPVRVQVDWRPEAVTVASSNPVAGRPAGVRPASGRGLTGIRHRAELLGGTFRAGPREGCFEVRVTLPSIPSGTPR